MTLRTPRRTLASTSAAVLAAAFAVLAPGLPGTEAAAQAPVEFPREAAEENRAFDPGLFDALEYRFVGPYRGGRVTAVTGVPGEPHTFYMGSTGGGVWRTTNAGESWENLTDGQIAVGSIGDIKVAPSDRNVIWLGTGSASPRGNVSPGNGVYRSTDAGESWTHVGLPDAGLVGNMQIHPDDPDVAYVAALGHIFGPNEQRGIFKTTDGGDSWEKVLFVSDSTGFIDVEMSPENPRVLYAAAWRAERKPWTMISGADEGGIWRSTDAGETWEKLEGGLPTGVVGKIGLTVSPADPDRVWALIEAEDPDGGLWRSDDGGDTWRRVNRDRDLRQRAWYYTYIEAHPTERNTLWGMNASFFKSIDGGKTFEQKPTLHGDNHDMWINPEHPEIMIEGNDGGAHVSVDGGETWSTLLNQPTAEFYTVTVDDQFPYRLYAPQQDNSTISIPSTDPGGITSKQHWFSIAGCETGPIALDPDDPSVVYSGCYSGTIDRWEEKTGEGRNVRIYPEIQIGAAPKDLEHRFQWNAPIEMSPHDPSVIYHASQHVLRTRDEGTSWEVLSPDLTTPEPEQLEASGVPVTHDETGVEVYPTVLSLRESPHEEGTLWAGTTDGHVHLSRDGGGSWTEVTPDAMPDEGTVNRIEISPHRAGKVYLSVYRYRMDDFSPYVFRTENHGEDWTLLTDGENGIPDGYTTRVAREDTEREGLLYAGTEFGLFVSFDDGERWQPLQQNLPATPVTDLKVRHGDLIVATQGRGLWIMDDVGPLRELDGEVAGSDRWLYTPADAWRAELGGFFGGGRRSPEPAPSGAVLRYWFAEAPEGEVTLEIVGADGEVVRTFTGTAGDDEGDGELPVEAGQNAFTWNLTHPEVDHPEGDVIWGYRGGYKALPGTYTARLAGDGWSQERTFEVKLDPRLDDVQRDELVEQAELAAAVHDTLDALYDQLRRIRRVRDQVEAGLERAEESGRADDGLGERADSLAQRLTELEETLHQTKNESRQDPLNFPPKLDAKIANLYGYVAGPDAGPTEGAHDRWEDLRAEWSEARADVETVIGEEVGAFRDDLESRGVPAVVTEEAGDEGGGG